MTLRTLRARSKARMRALSRPTALKLACAATGTLARRRGCAVALGKWRVPRRTLRLIRLVTALVSTPPGSTLFLRREGRRVCSPHAAKIAIAQHLVRCGDGVVKRYLAQRATARLVLRAARICSAILRKKVPLWRWCGCYAAARCGRRAPIAGHEVVSLAEQVEKIEVRCAKMLGDQTQPSSQRYWFGSGQGSAMAV